MAAAAPETSTTVISQLASISTRVRREVALSSTTRARTPRSPEVATGKTGVLLSDTRILAVK